MNHAIKHVINIIRGNHIEASQSDSENCVCNYSDNYYGDQVCVAVANPGNRDNH